MRRLHGSARRRWTLAIALAVLAVMAAPALAAAQVKIKDLIIADATVPVRLVGYGLVTGLDGTGDLTIGGRSGGQTVQSVVNLLRRFDIEVPPAMLRTRNVAAVLVTAELSPFLRPGGRFEVQVSSLGDARSLRGGVLWMTPLVPDVGAEPVATAQGSVLLSDGDDARNGRLVATSARIPTGGLLEQPLPRPAVVASNTLLLREPDLATATRMAAAIDSAFGAQIARVDDPGAVTLALPADVAGGAAVAMARIGDLRVMPDRASRIIIDARDGTVVAGGDLAVGAAVVSHAGVTLTISAAPAPVVAATAPLPAPDDSTTPVPLPEPVPGAEPEPVTARTMREQREAERDLRGDVRLPAGTSVQRIAAALHAAQSTPREIAAIFASLREVGALGAEVVVR
jgi:flagellar P-ring protein precursor FlgI